VFGFEECAHTFQFNLILIPTIPHNIHHKMQISSSSTSIEKKDNYVVNTYRDYRINHVCVSKEMKEIWMNDLEKQYQTEIENRKMEMQSMANHLKEQFEKDKLESTNSVDELLHDFQLDMEEMTNELKYQMKSREEKYIKDCQRLNGSGVFLVRVVGRYYTSKYIPGTPGSNPSWITLDQDTFMEQEIRFKDIDLIYCETELETNKTFRQIMALLIMNDETKNPHKRKEREEEESSKAEESNEKKLCTE
jgi:hypothetical protein